MGSDTSFKNIDADHTYIPPQETTPTLKKSTKSVPTNETTEKMANIKPATSEADSSPKMAKKGSVIKESAQPAKSTMVMKNRLVLQTVLKGENKQATNALNSFSEIFSTEQSYNKKLKVVCDQLNNVINELDNKNSAVTQQIKPLTKADFVKAHQLYSKALDNSSKLLAACDPNDLKKSMSALKNNAHSVLKDLSPIINNLDIMTEVIKKTNDLVVINSGTLNLNDKLNFIGYGAEPMQRITRYASLIESVVKNTPTTHEDYGIVKDAADAFVMEATKVNNASRFDKLFESETISDMKKIIKDIVKKGLKSSSLKEFSENLGKLSNESKSIKNNLDAIKDTPYPDAALLKKAEDRLEEIAKLRNVGIKLVHLNNLIHFIDSKTNYNKLSAEKKAELKTSVEYDIQMLKLLPSSSGIEKSIELAQNKLNKITA